MGALTTALVVAAGIAVGAGTASADPVTFGPLPVPFDLGAAFGVGMLPEASPPGANDPNCTPSEEHPNPVILVNPTGTNQSLAWQAGAPLLKNNGYCVFSFNYGNPVWLSEIPFQGLDDIRSGSRKLAAKVDEVRALTGAAKVDLVGHSQGGGIMPLYYLNVLGGDRYVDKMVGISPSNHGTSLNGIVFMRTMFPPLGPAVYRGLEAITPALIQQALDSPVQREVYGNGDTRPGVTYTTIVTEYDEVVTPYTNQYLDGPNVTNILLQDGCPQDRSDHVSTLYNERSWRFVLGALDPDNAAPVPCMPQGFLFPGNW
ncbi:esterase/lipase family protein [Rhodococcus sp. NPDC058505]|uniref:esterase/lipase family protein n=1 Tax=Rhodococcus sp. NPDC058505 TaxID=3346531 RepID=UPI00365B8BD2